MCKASEEPFSRQSICLTPVTIRLHSQTYRLRKSCGDQQQQGIRTASLFPAAKEEKNGLTYSSAIADTGSLMLGTT